MSSDGYPNWLSYAQYDHHQDDLETWCRRVAGCVCVRTDNEVVCPDPEDIEQDPRYPMLDWCEGKCMCTNQNQQSEEPFSGDRIREWMERARSG